MRPVMLTITIQGQSCAWAEAHGLQWAQLIGMATMANVKMMLFVTLMDCAKQLKKHFQGMQFFADLFAYKLLRGVDHNDEF